MALLQKAFTFNQKYVDEILSKCNKSNLADFTLDLYAIAKKSIRSINNEMKNQLAFFRYDESEWIDLDLTSYQIDKWFLLSLMTYFKPTLGLSTSEPFSYMVLSKLLPIIGWSSKKINKLKYGGDINELIYLSSSHPYASQIKFRQYLGGWISASEISELFEEITSLEKIFVNPNYMFINSLNNIGYPEIERKMIIKRSYYELLNMLEEPLNRKDCLFLIFD
jgi:hypothetical protein